MKKKRTTHFLIIKTNVKKGKLTQENLIMIQIIERQDL